MYRAAFNSEHADGWLAGCLCSERSAPILKQPNRAADVAAARRAISEGKEPSERAIDYVVERLLDELTW